MARVRMHGLVVVSCLVLGLLGRLPESSGGWVSCPPQMSVLVVTVTAGRPRSLRQARRRGRMGCDDWLWMSWPLTAMRSLAVAGLWLLGGCRGPCWLVGLPWLVWAWQVGSRTWLWLNGQPEWRLVGWLLWQGQRLALLGCLGQVMSQALHRGAIIDLEAGVQHGGLSVVLGLGCVVGSGTENRVSVTRQAEGSYQAEIEGHFRLQVGGDDPFRARLLLLFLRQLTEVGPPRRGGRTQDGRAPFVRQVQIAEWFGMAQPNVSRLERYWLAADWPNLLSVKAAEVLTPELRARVVAVFPAFPWWHLDEVYHHLREQGVAVTYDQVCQVARESGWLQLRQALRKRYQWSAEDFRPRDEWLVGQLLNMVESLLTQLEAGGEVTPEERLALNDLQTLAAEVGVAPAPPLKALPWLLRVEQILFGDWQAVDHGQVRCIYCGSTHVVRKSQRPRWKQYYDAEGQVQRVAVYRYYCRNRACSHRTFTD